MVTTLGGRPDQVPQFCLAGSVTGLLCSALPTLGYAGLTDVRTPRLVQVVWLIDSCQLAHAQLTVLSKHVRLTSSESVIARDRHGCIWMTAHAHEGQPPYQTSFSAEEHHSSMDSKQIEGLQLAIVLHEHVPTRDYLGQHAGKAFV